ncbi:GTP:AMP phosphotransferase AK3, mitochondrial-like isoform X2 [Asterias amurensis]|uniref:GTP:AMP phosphotransferase AK3, mitochondrial-like isoform X2 n=1 Tax=Asterias amurensis TaxID=7602 RepID=UPI003AB1D57D
MISRVFRAIILGPPGSGKGTISSRIVKDFKLTHLSSGDLLRAQVRGKTDAGLKASEYIERGGLVPDQLMVDLILNELKGLSSVDWLLDGFPRTVEQAKALADEVGVDSVINLKGKDDVTGELLTQRDDDKPETVLARLRAYQNLTSPVTDFYRDLDLLKEFTGTESDKIWPEVQKYLSTVVPPKS